MITAFHSILFSEDPGATRAFFRDVIGLPHVDAGGGWLIFKTGLSEMGVHPARDADGKPYENQAQYAVSFTCDDIQATIAELTAKGVEFRGDVITEEYGLVASMVVPGAGHINVYQPLHPTAYDL